MQVVFLVGMESLQKYVDMDTDGTQSRTANLGHSIWSQATEHARFPWQHLHRWLRTLLRGKVATESYGVFTAFVKNGKIFYTIKCFEHQSF